MGHEHIRPTRTGAWGITVPTGMAKMEIQTVTAVGGAHSYRHLYHSIRRSLHPAESTQLKTTSHAWNFIACLSGSWDGEPSVSET